MAAADEADEASEETRSPPQESAVEDELETYGTFADAVRATTRDDARKHAPLVDYIAQRAMADGCKTVHELHSWLAHQATLAQRSGFRAPDARHFPEPAIVQIGKYLRYAERARADLA